MPLMFSRDFFLATLGRDEHLEYINVGLVKVEWMDHGEMRYDSTISIL